MANVTIGDLTEKTDVDGTELVEIQDGTGVGASKSLAVEHLIDAAVRRMVLTTSVLGARAAEYGTRPGHVFQDAAGATAAGVGDPVGHVVDRSGNGNHATQSTTASKPTLRQDGGLYYLEFDGTDDFLDTGHAPDASGDFLLAVAVRYTAGSGINGLLATSGYVSTDLGYAFAVVDETPRLMIADGTDRYVVNSSVSSQGDGQWHVVVAYRRGTTGVVRVDGVEQDSIVVPGLDLTTTDPLLMGTDGSVEYGGDLTGPMMVVGEISDADVSRIEQYLAILAGVAL